MPIPWVRSIREMRDHLRAARGPRPKVGLVPTMGGLHEGHATLIREARRRADMVVASVFVNPTQFGPSEDYSRYPRTPERDRRLAEEAGANLIFAPDADAMYGTGGLRSFVEVPGLSEILEGRSRPGHFRGVATVVLKLLNIVEPDFAWFGLKDYQQFLVIRTMAIDLDLRAEILGVPTVREPDGLALSSRNAYLGADDRRAATVLSRSLNETREAALSGRRSAESLRESLSDSIRAEPRATLDYAEIADADTLAPLVEIGPDTQAVALVAARFGSTRLIDNIRLAP